MLDNLRRSLVAPTALALLVLALATGVAVAQCGLVAFVGLIAPHAVRLLGVRAHRALLPCALLALSGQGWLRGVGDLRSPLIIVAIASAANIVLEVVLVLVSTVGSSSGGQSIGL